MIKTCEELNQARVQAQLEIQSYAWPDSGLLRHRLYRDRLP